MDKTPRRNVTQGMLGTLRSELDDAPELTMPFQALEAGVQSVRLSFLEGKISAEHAANVLRELKLTDHEGNEWTIGATSTRWFRRVPGTQWQLAGYPERVSPAGEEPRWVRAGVAEMLIVAKEQPDADTVIDSAPVPLAATFAPVAASPSGMRDDADWLFSEWESNPTPLAKPGPVTLVGGVGLPGETLTSWEPTTGLAEAIGPLTPMVVDPTAREKDALDDDAASPDVQADAYARPDDRDAFRLPEEFFRPYQPDAD